jgi:hypothetical protein
VKPENFIMMPIPADRYSDVCALLGGVALLAASPTKNDVSKAERPAPIGAEPAAVDEQPERSADAGASQAVTDENVEIDAHGHPWSADLHASTKGKTKDGLWRMKVGVTRPAPLPGFPVDEDDEFAAFRNAAAASDATDKTAAESIPARQYSDADLGALCNQAAVKLGDPGPVKAIIAKYTPEGSVAHSRNIPTEQRAAFVGEVEAAAGITFVG